MIFHFHREHDDASLQLIIQFAFHCWLVPGRLLEFNNAVSYEVSKLSHAIVIYVLLGIRNLTSKHNMFLVNSSKTLTNDLILIIFLM
jgi:hypothetical protein